MSDGRFIVNGEEIVLAARQVRDGVQLTLGEETLSGRIRPSQDPSRVLLELDGRLVRGFVTVVRGVVYVAVEGRSFRFEPVQATGGGIAAAAEDVLTAPMTGTVIAVHAEVGSEVAMGTPLAVVEAMKMEHRLLAPRDGVVAEVPVAAGDKVEMGALIVRLEAAG